MSELHGKTAFVSGVSKGIGRAIVMALTEEGVNVTGTARTKSALDSLAEESSKNRGDFLGIAGDISIESEVKEGIRQTVDKFGGIDILINNAGIGIFKPVQELSLDEWDKVMNTNIRGTFLATRFALPHMIKKNAGSIINISSIAGKRGFGTGAAYCASKFAMMGFSQSLMFDVRPHNIRVITICPGSVATPFHVGGAMDKEEGHVLTPKDCADTVIYALRLPQSAAAHEIELRITNP